MGPALKLLELQMEFRGAHNKGSVMELVLILNRCNAFLNQNEETCFAFFSQPLK
jgi:hypothetical protein